jgi:hypothetical protein
MFPLHQRHPDLMQNLTKGFFVFRVTVQFGNNTPALFESSLILRKQLMLCTLDIHHERVIVQIELV